MKGHHLNKRNLLILGVIIILCMVSSCEYAQREPLDPNSLPEEVSFSEHLLPLFEAKCAICHEGSQPPDLTVDYAYSDLSGGNYINTESPESSLLYEEITGNGSMAPYANDYDRALVLKWIEQGAHEN